MKSIDEKAYDYVKNNCNDYNKDQKIEVLVTYIDAYKEAYDWILLNDELPLYYLPVLLKRDHHIVCGWRAVDDNGKNMYTITETDNLFENPTHFRYINVMEYDRLF